MSSLRDPWRILRTASLAGGLLSFAACSRSGLTPSSGVLVESLGARGAGAQAGLRTGDVLLSWHRQAAPPANPREAEGNLKSCSDVAEVEVEEAPRGRIELRVQRGSDVSRIRIPAGDWGLEVRPRAAKGPEVAGCEAYAQARQAVREGRRREALQLFQGAEAWALRAGRTRFAALVLQERSEVSLSQDDFTAMENDLRESLQQLRQAAPGSLMEAEAWHLLGRMERRRAAFAAAEPDLRQALMLRTQLAPESLERAATVNNLGIIAMGRGDRAGARELFLQALDLIRRRSPGSLDEGQLLNNLGLLARAAGDSALAESSFVQANRILQRVAPESEDLARNQTNLATTASDRGDAALAEEYDLAALSYFEARAPQSLETAKLLANLGIIARDRFNFEEAETLFRRALAIQRQRAPGSVEEASGLSNLAWVLSESGRQAEAEECVRGALSIRSRLTPGSPDVALSLGMLGAIASKRGDFRTATSLGEQALALQRRIAPGTLQEGDELRFLGSIALEAGRLEPAETYGRQALAISRRLAPQSRVEAESLDLIGTTLARLGHAAEAEDHLLAAAAALEAQIGRLGGTGDPVANFQARWGDIYQHLIELQIQRGKGATALQALERWRGRGLLAQIAQRDLAFSADIPAPLLKRQHGLDQQYRQVQMRIAEANPENKAEIQANLVQLSRLRNERLALEDSVVHASPRYASLRHPQPLDLVAARGTLDPGTVWLSYFVTPEATFLFLVTPASSGEAEGPRIFRLAAGGDALAEETATFRGLILRGEKNPKVEPALLVEGRKLYNLLIAPAAPWIERADRVLISPDGPLHTLPFAALVRPGKRPEWLLEWKPIHTVLSATLYAELKQGRRALPAGGGPLVALADPVYRPVRGATAEADDSPLRRYRAGLAPLPGAREEVQALSTLYGGDAHVYIGAGATKERIEHLPPGTRFLHFACHALLDRRFPLDSALALAPSRDGNGMLQSWEIFERLRIDADLVTLSACSTGLGRNAGGEGLIGLTRAFQYAGARSVLASLWAVSDRSTAALMTRFYTKLRAGSPKDVALAEAQRELLREHRFSHPYSWAAFELNGDWK